MLLNMTTVALKKKVSILLEEKKGNGMYTVQEENL